MGKGISLLATDTIQCKQYFAQLERTVGHEILVDTNQPQTVEQMEQLMMHNGSNQRRAVRDNRLLKYEQQAKRDQDFQEKVIEGLHRVFISLDKLEKERKANECAILCLLKLTALDQPERAKDIIAAYCTQIR